MNIAIVTGCDANYYPLLKELIASIRQFDASNSFDICVIDSGLLPEQVDELYQTVSKVVAPEWPAEIPTERTAGYEYLKACICRPFIPELFPGYEMYLWLDADTWVQRWSAIEMFIEAAKSGDRVSLTNGADRAYGKLVRISWFLHWPRKVKNFYSSNGRKPFGKSFAKNMVAEYVVSAGCFAMTATAPHWKRWQELVVEAATKGKLFPAEQLALGKLIHIEGYRAELLPAYTHWLCEFKPKWDAERNLFVEPYMPHEPLGVLHLSGVDEMRADRSVKVTLETVEGQAHEINYRYPGFDGGALKHGKPARI